MNAVPPIWSQAMSLVVKYCTCALLEVLLGINQSFALLLCFCLWGEDDGHSPGYSRGILFVTFWLAEAARMMGSPASFPVNCRDGVLFQHGFDKYPRQLAVEIYDVISENACCLSTVSISTHDSQWWKSMTQWTMLVVSALFWHRTRQLVVEDCDVISENVCCFSTVSTFTHDS